MSSVEDAPQDGEPCDCGRGPGYWDADPFLSEISGDDTPVFQCYECAGESALEI